MDKAEYQERLKKLQDAVRSRDYASAYEIVESIDWRRVKSIQTLNMVADVYEVNKDYDKCRNILNIALDRSSIGKSVLYRLTECCIKQKDIESAEKYFERYCESAGKDSGRLLLQYKLLKAKNAPVEQQIEVLEHYKDSEYTERWAYELALLYSKADETDKCVEACDDMILWFGEGKYVIKAMELKRRYKSLTPSQQKYYDKEQKDSDARVVFTKSPDESVSVDVPTQRGSMLERLDAAGAKAAENTKLDKTQEMPLTGTEIDELPVTSSRFMGGRPDLKQQLEQSIKNVYDEAEEAPGTEENAPASDVIKTDEAQTRPQEDSQPQPGQIIYDEREIPDPEPSPQEKKSHTITLSKIGQNTAPLPLEEIMKIETPEERRIRILNSTQAAKMNDAQRKIFTYFSRIPGMDGQILKAMSNVYQYAGEHTSRRGNVVIMGAPGTGKSRLSRNLIAAMCQDLQLEVAKVARVKGEKMNLLDPAAVVAKMSGGFLIIEDASEMTAQILEKLNKAMEFKTECMVLIIEDEKNAMRALLKANPDFADKFTSIITIPVFTNDELITFARTYCEENDCQMDELGILALYSLISSGQSEEQPMTITQVRDILDGAIARAKKGGRKGRKTNATDKMILLEKDFMP